MPADFLTARRLFAVMGDSVLLGGERSGLGRRDWLAGLFGWDEADRLIDGGAVTGYVLGSNMVVDASPETVDHRAVVAAIKVLRHLYSRYTHGLGCLTSVVFAFAVPTDTEEWPAGLDIEVGDYMSRVRDGAAIF